jgi:two-component system phosphate regulon sensor histidine kinase PhoR
LSSPWFAEFRRIALIALAALLTGAIFDHGILFLAVGLLLYFGWHLYQLFRLERWLRVGRRFNPPEAWGIWGEVFHHIYRLQKRNRQRKRRLAAILNQYQKATSAMPDATVVLTSGGEIQWFNGAARQLLALKPGQDTGQRIDNLIRHPAFVEFVSGESDAESMEMPSPQDGSITLNVKIVPYGNEQRLLIARDVSERLRLEQMRRDFIGNVSHELRTPLTVVSGFLETLSDGDDPCAEQWRKSLELMRQQSTRMQHLVDDLLLLSRLETDRHTPPDEIVPVPAMLAIMKEDAQLLSGDAKHHITLETPSDARLYGAERELYSAFNNLVTNAVRYTPEGGRIEIRWEADETGARFSVTDSGIGIAPQHIPRITERFYRADPARSRQSGGTGLGLAIVKHVLNRHQARLEIRSEPGKGSTFTCVFPAVRVVPGTAREGIAERT